MAPAGITTPLKALSAAVALVCCLSAGLLGGSTAIRADEALEIIYLANEGFLLRTGETAVLVDAVFGDGLFGYGTLDERERQRLETAQPPYDSVDLALASHFHGDHFDVAAMARFLAASAGTRLVSTEQAAAELLAFDAALANRVQGLYPGEDEPLELHIGPIELTLFNLHHGRGRPRVQNLGLLVEICGVRVLHVGDAEANSAEMRVVGLQGLAPDVALLPSWYLRPGRWAGAPEQVIEPRRVVAMHLPTSDAPESYFWGGLDSRPELAEAIKAGFPDAFVPLRHGESIVLPCR